MATNELIERKIIHLARLDSEALRNGQVSLDDWKRIHAKAGALCNASDFIDDGAYTIAEISMQARRWRQKNPSKEGLIVVDYLQLAEGGKGQNRERTVADISRGLKKLAKELAVPVIALSQLNRKVEESDREPMLSDLRESGAIEQDADVIIFLHKNQQSRLDDHIDKVYPSGVDTVKIIVAKNRNGRTGKFDATWTGKHYLFE